MPAIETNCRHRLRTRPHQTRPFFGCLALDPELGGRILYPAYPRPSFMNGINFTWPLEHAETLAELELIVARVLEQFDMVYFHVLYPDASWPELGEILETECEENERMSTLAYWLEIAENQKNLLSQ